MAKTKVANPWSAIQKIAVGGKVEDMDLFIRDIDKWIGPVEGAHMLSSTCCDIQVSVHNELAKLLEILNKEVAKGE